MKILKIVISILFFVVIGLIIFLQIDDDINPEAQQAYELVTAQKESKAYIYLLGIHAGADDKPENIGRKTYQSILKMQKSNPFDENKHYSYKYPDEKKLPLFNLASKKENHIETLFLQELDSAKLSKEQLVLLKRYNQFMAMNDYHTLAKPSADEPQPPYKYLISANDLLLLKAIDNAKKGQLNQSKNSILNNISNARMQLKNADSMIIRAVYIQILSANLDVLSSLIHQYKIPFKEHIATLTKEEKDDTKAIYREFSSLYNLFNSFQKYNTVFEKDSFSVFGITVSSWVARTLFKQNMSINSIYPSYKQFVDTSLLPPQEFAKAVNTPIKNIKKKFSLRNNIGFQLAGTGGPNYNSYSARGFYLDSKIQIFNQTAKQMTLPENFEYIQNPFYINKTAFYSKDKNQVCFKGPLSENVRQYLHCLRVNAD